MYSQEILADEEPKYLRRQKPVEIKRRKFAQKVWKTYLRVTAWAVAGAAGAGLVYGCVDFLWTSPEMAVIRAEQLETSGNHNVSRASLLDVFQNDRGRSIVRIPLGVRQRQIESIPWVEQATVRRVLPRTLQVEIVERTPIAFLRNGNEMALVDAHGVIFERPVVGRFHFPVVTGIGPDMPTEEREKRMQLFTGFLQGLALARSKAPEQVSEVDLSDAHDLRASLTGLPGGAPEADGRPTSFPDAAGDSEALTLVHFGDGDFESKYETLMDKMGQWRAAAGRVESVDLRFNGEAVVNSDTPAREQHVSPSKRGTPHAR